MEVWYVWGGFLLLMSAVNMGVTVKLQRQMRALTTRVQTLETPAPSPVPVPIYVPPTQPYPTAPAQIVRVEYGNPQNV